MAKPVQSRSTSASLWIAGIGFAVALVFAIRYLTRDTVIVRTTPATFQTIASTVATNGNVQPVGEYQAHAPFSGVVQVIHVDIGDHVEVGSPLLDMDPSDARKQAASAQASLASAQRDLADLTAGGTTDERSRFSTDLATAKADQRSAANSLAVEQALQQKGSASAGEVAAAQAKVDTANLAVRNASGRTQNRFSSADVAAAQARVADARASVASAHAALAAVSIHSLVAGTVYAEPVSQYDFVQAGKDLIDVADLSHLQVDAYFDEPEIGKLAHGQPVKIVWEAKPGVVWRGHIERAPTSISVYGNRNVGECFIALDSPSGDLLPNTNVTVTVTESQRVNVLTIPREALRIEGTHSFVYRIVDGKLARTLVQTGVVNNISAEITSGLKANDIVVLNSVDGGKELTNGLTVKAAP